MIAILLAVLLLAAPAIHDGAPPRRTVRIRAPAWWHRGPVPSASPPGFREKRGPHCIDADAIAGAAVMAPDSVDFSLKGGARVRARLENACPALDYYRGFYVSPGADGRICADRDAIHTRSGGECGIDRFRSLSPPR